MSDHIPAIYDSGVFRPLGPVDWPQGTRAEVVLPSTASQVSWPANYFEQTAGSFAGEVLERPTQGDLPRREEW
jgi:predicted DNA-binding antitoxin AbrB/MazE fold protein